MELIMNILWLNNDEKPKHYESTLVQSVKKVDHLKMQSDAN